MRFSTGFLTLTHREIYRFFSVFSQTITPPLISSFLYILIFGYSIGSRIDHIEGVSYLQFLIPGLVMMYVIDSAYANTSSSLFISRWAGHIEEILVTPLSSLEMVLAILIGGLVRAMVIAVGIYAVSLLFIRFPIEHAAIMIFFLVAVALVFSALGMIVALFAEEFEHLTMATTFVITPLVYLGGVFNSVEMMPQALRWILHWNPMFYMINGLRYGMLGFSDAPVFQCVTVVFGLFIVLFSCLIAVFQTGYKLRK